MIHTLLHFTPELADMKMEKFESMDAALERAEKIDIGRHVYLSIPDEGAPNGIRVSKVERSEAGSTVPVDPTGPQVTSLHNAMAEKPVTRFATRGAAMDKTTKMLNERFGGEEKKLEARTEAVSTNRVAQEKERLAGTKGRGGRKQAHADDMVVVIKAEKNPKREGTNAHGRFADMVKAVKAGKNTVAEVLATGVTRGDLAYDANHNYIEVVKA